jgi:hypothetical protein
VDLDGFSGGAGTTAVAVGAAGGVRQAADGLGSS